MTTDDGRRKTEDRGQRGWTLLICIVLAAATLVAFEQVRNNDFVNYDDELYITDNAFVRGGLNAQSIAWAFTSRRGGNWHPFTWISHIIDCAVFGANPGRHHLVSVAFHIANVVLLFLILKKVTGALWRSAFVAAIFGLHPLAVESVAWVAQRKTVLSAFFAFLTMAAYFRYVRKPGFAEGLRRGGPGLWRYIVVIVAFAAGLLAKPMLVTLPFVLILLDFWPLGRFDYAHHKRFWSLLVEKVPLVIISAVFCVVTYRAQVGAGAVADIVSVPLGLRLGNALVSYVGYIGKLFYPVPLAVLYPLDLKGPALWQAGVILVLLVLVSSSAVVLRRRYGFLLTGWFWYLGTLVPVIGLVQVGQQSMADRYMYLPGIGIYIIAVWFAGEAAAKLRLPKIVPASAGVLVLVLLMLTTRAQVGYWKNSLSLCQHALAVTKDNYVMHNNCGEFLRITAVRTDEAIWHYRRALEINPTYAEAHNNLGCALEDKGLMDEAAAEYKLAMEIRPGYARAHNNYGVTLARRRRYDEAIEQFSKSLATDPYYSSALHNLCKAGTEGARLDVASEIIRGLKQKAPANAELYYRAGTIYGMQGDTEKAVEQLERALEMANNQGKKELVEQITKQLELYRRTKRAKQ